MPFSDVHYQVALHVIPHHFLSFHEILRRGTLVPHDALPLLGTSLADAQRLGWKIERLKAKSTAIWQQWSKATCKPRSFTTCSLWGFLAKLFLVAVCVCGNKCTCFLGESCSLSLIVSLKLLKCILFGYESVCLEWAYSIYSFPCPVSLRFSGCGRLASHDGVWPGWSNLLLQKSGG